MANKIHLPKTAEQTTERNTSTIGITRSTDGKTENNATRNE